MKSTKRFTLDGRNMQSQDAFYQEIQRVLCPGFTKMGRNENALVDVLRGGFGVFEYEEKIELDFIHPKKALKGLGHGFFKNVIKIFKSHPNVTFLPDLDKYLAHY